MTGPLTEGTIVDGKYRIEKFLGEGGMGIVYQAIEVDLERHVAIKLLKGELTGNAQLVQRFRDELRVLANFNHPNITTLLTSFNWEGMPAMVMELVEGETFRNMVYRRGPIPDETSVPLVIQALHGVAVAHNRGIVHRDLKPENLMLNTGGTVKVMDFGIAKMEQATGFTRTSATIGTPHYMSPEQIDPHRFGMTRADARTDIYSMGITLYEMLAGEVPFSGPSEFSVQRAHLEERPQPPTYYYPHIRPEVVAAVCKAMEKDPAQRYQTAVEFSLALQAALSGAPAVVIAQPQQSPIVAKEMAATVREVTEPATVARQLDKTVPHQETAKVITTVAEPDTPKTWTPVANTTVPQTLSPQAGFTEPDLAVTPPDSLLNRWFGHTGRPRLVASIVFLLLLCLLGGGIAGLVAILRPNPVPIAKGFSGGGGGGGGGSNPFNGSSQTPQSEPKNANTDDGGVNIQLPPAGTSPKTGGVKPVTSGGQQTQQQLPPPLPALASLPVAGVWAGNFKGCSGSALTEAAISLKPAESSSDDVVPVIGTMLVHTDTGNVKCNVDGTYSKTRRSLVISSSCPASAPSFIAANHKSQLSLFAEGKMMGTVAPENCAVANFHKD